MAKTKSKKIRASVLLVAILVLHLDLVQGSIYTTTACASGFYNYSGKFCKVCPNGFYCKGGWNQFPLKCQPGYYSAFQAASCTACPAGFQCADPTLPPVACKSGYFSDKGSTICTICPAGSRCPSDTLVQTLCNVGEDCSDSTDIQVKKVIAGYNAFMPSVTPTVCASGSYSAEGDKVCTPCPAGFFCPDPSHPPIACPSGYYQDQQGQASCTICPLGYFCASTTASPVKCALGWYASQQGAIICTQCPASYSCLDPTASPQPCSSDRYAPVGSAVCFYCPAGYDCSTSRYTTGAPVICTAGSYALTGNGYCTKCPPGWFCMTVYLTPMPCSPGYTTNGQNGQQYCTQCVAGQDCSRTDAKSQQCPYGTFSFTMQQKCQNCPFGHYCPNGTLNQAANKCTEGNVVNQARTACVACPLGYQCPSGEWDQMSQCSPGYYSYLSTTAGTGYCTACPAASYCVQPDVNAVACPSGWWADIGQTYCNRCPPGQNCLDQTGRHIVDCPHGFYYDWLDAYGTKCPIYNPSQDTTFYNSLVTLVGTAANVCPTVTTTAKPFCTQCPAGYFCPNGMGGDRSITNISLTTPPATPINALQACVDGTWSKAGATVCILAEPGFFPTTTKDGQTECKLTQYSYGNNLVCTDCPRGHECTFMKNAVPCPIFFWSENGEQDCYNCPVGKDCRNLKLTATNGGSNTASAEIPGLLDFAAAKTCPQGTYTMPHNFYCVTCPIGHSCALGALVPTKCSPGTYAYAGSSTCSACPNEYWSDVGQEYCTPVPPGMKTSASTPGFSICAHTFYSQWGEMSCTSCPDGFLCTEKHNYPTNWAYSCPKGSFCIKGVQTKCPNGYFGTMERATTQATGCELCPAGYDCQAGTEHFMQVPCPLGYYCPDGSAYAHPCPAGTYGEQLYGKSLADCVPCDVGTQCSANNAGQGAPCDMGYFCPRGSAVNQYPCPAGTHGGGKTGKRDLSECLPCPPGYYCPSASATPTAALPGYYSTLSGMPSLASLFLCPPKYFCPNSAMTSYKAYPCPIGYYCPLGTSTINQYPCPQGTYSDRQELHDPTQCLICPKGFFCNTASTTASLQTVSGSSMAGECTKHHYCPEGTWKDYIPNCPAGTYAPYYRSLSVEDCLPCPPGSWCNAGAGPQPCDMGYYCPEGTENRYQFPCPAGYYNDQTSTFSIMACKPCGIGNACPIPGMTTLASVKCPDGYYNDQSTVAISCTICTQGFYCANLMTGSTPMNPHPIPCSSGYYSDYGATACTLCPVGTYCPLEGTSKTQMLLNVCPKGVFCSRTFSGQNVGLDVYPNKDDYGCPQYYVCPPGTTFLIPIPPGTMVKMTGAEGFSDAIQLPAGWFSKTFEDLSVESFIQAAGYQSSTTCNPGYYCPPGSFAAIPCPAGHFRANYYGRDISDCGKCPAGTYCPSAGIAIPTQCDAGYFCPEGSILKTPCPLGTYNPSTSKYDSRDCTKCDPGFYCPVLAMTAVDTINYQCDAGYICKGGSNRPEPTDGVSGDQCPVGYYCVKAQGAAGTIDSTTDIFTTGPNTGGLGLPQSCIAGQMGLYLRAFSHNDCIACKPGYFCPGGGENQAAVICPEGYFCPSPYPSTQTAVGLANIPSFYTDASGSKLLQTQPGYYAAAGQYVQLPCNIGMYQNEVNSAQCKGCPAGTFCNVPNISNPTTTNLCPAGYYCISYDATQQTCQTNNLTPGYYIGGIFDTSQCYLENVLFPCPPGTYAGSYVLGVAPTGYIKQAQCVACPAGYACPEYAMSKDTTSLPKCAAGYFCVSSATTPTPTILASGLYGPCPQGYWCLAGSTSPTTNPCPIGTFSNQARAIDSSYCIPCPPGYLCDSPGLTAPTGPCPAGSSCYYVQDATTKVWSLQQSDCGAHNYCPIGTYKDFECPAGFFSSQSGFSHCIQCYSGSYCLGGVLNTCSIGYYCP